MSAPEIAATHITHALDASLQVERISTGHLRGEPPLACWNMVGPYGGISAAIVLNAVMRDERCLGDPPVLTIITTSALAQIP